MAVAVGDLFRVNMLGTCFNQRIILTHAYTVTAINPGQTEASVTNNILNAIRGGGGGDQWETDYLNCLPPQYTLDKIQVQKTHPLRFAYLSVNRSVPGLHAGATTNTNLTATITFKGELGARHNISNKKIGPIPGGAGVQVDGKIALAYLNLLDTLGLSMMLPITHAGSGLTAQPVIPNSAQFGPWTRIVENETGTTVNAMTRRTVGHGE